MDIRELYTRLQRRLSDVANETEVRDRFCGEIYSALGINFRMERGHSDARINRVILEFKDKGLFAGRATSAKFQEAFTQLAEKYIPEQAAVEGLPLHHFVGIAIDGQHYAFILFDEDGSYGHTSLLPINEESLLPLMEAIVLDTRRAFTIENLSEDFGPNSDIASVVIQELWKHLNASLEPDRGVQKTVMLFKEWTKLFAQATSLGRIGREKIDDFLLSIGLAPPLDHTRALFVLHTYNALLLKLLAAELISTLGHREYMGFCAEAAGQSPAHVHELLANRIEHAEIFINHGLENFIEGTFFSWYIENSPNPLLNAIRAMLARLALYAFPSSPHSRVRDVIKTFYQNLVPPALRKNIGEFYTPEWLVEFVLDRAGYDEDSALKKRLLDPCCGSGNFLIHAIARYRKAAEAKGRAPGDIASGILNDIVGFDLNPLAVIAARVNYLLAISDLILDLDRIEIPVYLADAVYAPVRAARNGAAIRTYKIGTVLGSIELTLPEALVQQRASFGVALSIMARDIESDDTRANYLAHIMADGTLSRLLEANPSWAEFLGDMFDAVQIMEQQNWNRIWCRIVRNYFASIAVGQVDIIAGNPPWVRWSELPEDYRERIKPTCSEYAIFSRTPFFGGNELDISGMIAYTASDKWLRENGVLAFVITQVHFQAPSSEGFRSFHLPDGTPLRVSRVDDFTQVKPFPGLANKPAVFVWQRDSETEYPVEYKVWHKIQAQIPEDAPLSEVASRISAQDMLAVAIPPDARWCILSPEHLPIAEKLAGGSADVWQGRKGITTDLNGVYFVDLIRAPAHRRTVLVRTAPDSGKKPIPLLDAEIEKELIYPLLKGGGQIRPFSYTPLDRVAIIPNAQITNIPDEATFRRDYPAAYRYFRRINRVPDASGDLLLEARSTWKSRMLPTGAPFFAIYNVGSYTFSRYKVVWAEIAGTIAAAVVSMQEIPGVGIKPIIPDHKVYFVAPETEDEAHFLCGMLNSEPVRVFVDGFTVKLQVGTLFRHVNIPRFDPADAKHHEMANLSKEAHHHGLSEPLQLSIDRLAWLILD